jgi:hypothetical protein
MFVQEVVCIVVGILLKIKTMYLAFYFIIYWGTILFLLFIFLVVIFQDADKIICNEFLLTGQMYKM